MLEPQSMPSSGQTLAGKYTLVRTLGEGGMGIVYEARHVKLGHRCAIKVLRPEVVTDAETVARFEREARAAAGLASRHVCRVTDVGARDDGAPFLVMEFLEGRDLGAEVESRGPLPIAEACGYLLQACEALEEAHAKGIVHRDLKPENLFLARDGSGVSVKLLDFGISKVEEEGNVSVTRTQSSIGTPLYMSPEQTRSTKKVDLRTDIWALGVILYELLTADVPFNGDSATAVAVSVAVDRHPALCAKRPDAPRELEAVIDRALQKDPEARFQTVRAFAQAIAPFAVPGAAASWERAAEEPRSREPSVHETQEKIANAATLVDAAPKESPRSLGLPLMGALLGAALAAAAGLFLFVRSQRESDRGEERVALADHPQAKASSAASPAPIEEQRDNVTPKVTRGDATALAAATATAGVAQTAAPTASATGKANKPNGGEVKAKPSATPSSPVTTPPKPVPTLPTKI